MEQNEADFPSTRQINAILNFAKRHRPEWMPVLASKWRDGSELSEPHGADLRQLRDSGGPAWLGSLCRGGPLGTYRGWTIWFDPKVRDKPLLLQRDGSEFRAVDAVDFAGLIDVRCVLFGEGERS